jgi:hypothetical protein
MAYKSSTVGNLFPEQENKKLAMTKAAAREWASTVQKRLEKKTEIQGDQQSATRYNTLKAQKLSSIVYRLHEDPKETYPAYSCLPR